LWDNGGMKLKPADLSAHLARQLLPIYVVSGDEPLLIQESLDVIREAARRKGYSEREIVEADKGYEWQQLVESCGSLSLFASLRIIEVRLSATPNNDGVAVLQQLAERPPSDVLLIVVCGPLDTRQRGSAWFAALETAGASVYAWPIAGNEFEPWLAGRLVAAGLRADDDALHLLAERTEGNALAAAQDVAKLALLFPNSAIGVEQVREAVADSSRFDAFDLTDRMLSGDAPGAVRSLTRLREEGVEVIELLGALTWCLRQWADAQAALTRGGDAQRAVDSARIARPRQGPYLRALRRTRLPQVYGWLRRAATIDQLAKSTGGKEQAWEELLTLVVAATGAAPRFLNSRA
jgi:DNA polymerase-3 subunit delta